ncbi:uncharacterized protein METZ01_LOCUS31804 [marine metagenome]|uniref:Uncharacterized protein n=1 Tax=marine metagenome TaxID=408172 RepID=A0A381QIZ3_9ZZZZ
MRIILTGSPPASLIVRSARSMSAP